MNSFRRYTKQHVWVKLLAQDRIQLGITSYAQRRLGEIICVEWPREGEYARQDQSIGTLESSKTVSDLYAPVDGWVLEINPRLRQRDLTVINEQPLEEGWIAIMRMERPSQAESWLTEEQYQAWVEEE